MDFLKMTKFLKIYTFYILWEPLITCLWIQTSKIFLCIYITKWDQNLKPIFYSTFFIYRPIVKIFSFRNTIVFLYNGIGMI